uniref:Bm1133 n=1 Tax=Brugia malayi TaxID=6279 RepID=A0A0J9XMA9_BRUMA|nr:Bm1133 [Brugia malayi]
MAQWLLYERHVAVKVYVDRKKLSLQLCNLQQHTLNFGDN